jgi:uncharacterized protein YjiS (DUF1127 family)
MREFCQHEASSRMAYGRWTWAMRVLGNWRMRSDLKRIQKFSDYQLRDIGLTQDDLSFFLSLPLNSDVCWETERRQLLRGRD